MKSVCSVMIQKHPPAATLSCREYGAGTPGGVRSMGPMGLILAPLGRFCCVVPSRALLVDCDVPGDDGRSNVDDSLMAVYVTVGACSLLLPLVHIVPAAGCATRWSPTAFWQHQRPDARCRTEPVGLAGRRYRCRTGDKCAAFQLACFHGRPVSTGFEQWADGHNGIPEGREGRLESFCSDSSAKRQEQAEVHCLR